MRQRILAVAHSPVSLVARILAVAALALVLLAGTLLVVITQVVDRTVYAQSQATVTHADTVLRYLVAQKGAPALIDGKLTFGRWVANNDNAVVDQLERLTGATATLFQALPHGRYIRVATTIRNAQGRRNIGTLVLGPAAATVARGHTYTGVNPILGRPYVTEYALIRDQRGRPIGLTYTGIPLTTLARAEGHMVAVVLVATLAALVVGLGLLAVALRPIGRAITQLETLALTDPLTGLGNHRAYQEALRRETARATRDALPLALALIDVDDFKTINDRYGHVQGDRTLTALGALLRALRAGDAAFRLGGDEFALLLPHTSRMDARVALERVRARAPHVLGGATVSGGLAVAMPGEPAASDGSALGADTLQERADAALYEAKRRGRDAVVPFTDIGEGAAVLPSAKVRAVRCLLAEGRVRGGLPAHLGPGAGRHPGLRGAGAAGPRVRVGRAAGSLRYRRAHRAGARTRRPLPGGHPGPRARGAARHLALSQRLAAIARPRPARGYGAGGGGGRGGRNPGTRGLGDHRAVAGAAAGGGARGEAAARPGVQARAR